MLCTKEGPHKIACFELSPSCDLDRIEWRFGIHKKTLADFSISNVLKHQLKGKGGVSVLLFL